MTMRIGLFFGALLLASSASAQERKVWTDADLARPLPQLQRQVDPETLAALKRRADYIPNFYVYRGGSGGGVGASDAGLQALESYYSRELSALKAKVAAIPTQPLYAAQPLYPYAAVVYSNRPIYPSRRLVPPAAHRRK